jgi:hypothetical protein
MLALCCLAAGTPPAGDGGEVASAETSLEALQAERALDPEEPGLLVRYGRALGEAGDEDGELACLLLARDAYDRHETDDEAAVGKALRTLDKRLDAIDSSLGRLDSYRGKYVGELAQVLRLYGRNQKKLRNALDVAEAILRYRPGHVTARSIVDEVLAADPSLTDEANRLLALRELRRPRSFLVDWARRHRDWSSAGRASTPGYDVRCNIGYDVMQRAATSLEQVARFYSRFYGVDTGRQSGRTLVRLYRTRAEFLEDCGESDLPDAFRAFLRSSIAWSEEPGGRRILDDISFELYAYDPRDDGMPLEMLDTLLFHEASHQYMALAAGAWQAPAWLNEGAACYFEGVRIDEDGRVLPGLPATHRLRALHRQLDRRGNGAPDDADERAAWNAQRMLRSVAESPGDDFLTSEHYAVSWGIVYFLFHEQDEDGAYRFRPLLREAIAAAGRGVTSGGQLFDESVLAASGLTLASFAERWAASMTRLYEQDLDRVAHARELVERGERWFGQGEAGAAREAFLAALLRDPRSVSARLGLARLRSGSRDKADADDVLLWARQAWRAAVAAGDDAGREAAQVLADSVDPAGFRRIQAAEQTYREKVGAAVERQLARDRPRTALVLSRLFLDDVLGDEAHHALSRRLAAEGTRFSRTLAAFDGESLEGLFVSARGVRVEDGAIRVAVERPGVATLVCERAAAPSCQLRGELLLEDANTLVSLMLSEGEVLGTRGFCVRPALREDEVLPPTRYAPFDLVEPGQVAELQERFDERSARAVFDVGAPRAARTRPPVGEWVEFVLDRSDPAWLVLHVGGQEVARRPVPDSRLPVQPGLIVYGGTCRIRALQVVEFDRL